MTSQGSAGGRFQRAIERRQLFAAELAARELGSLTLARALALCELLAHEQDPRFERAAVKWHGRFVVERGIGSIAESQLALSALASLPRQSEEAHALLRALARQRGVV